MIPTIKRHTKKTRHNRKTRRHFGGKSSSGKKWTTAIDAAQKTLKKTGSVTAARKSLRKQALANAKKLFGAVSTL